jgi:hypothetical protein
LPLSPTSDTGRAIGRTVGLSNFYLKRYTGGPAVEIGLLAGFRLEAAVLYKHARRDYSLTLNPFNATLVQQGERVDIWEIPLLVKYRWKSRGLFAIAGSTLRRVEDIHIDRITINTFPNIPANRQIFTNPSFEPLRYGVTIRGGVSSKILFLYIEPELRYTHWTAKHWLPTTEQLEFLLGVRLGVGRTQ